MTTAPERPPVDSPARAAARWWADHLTRVAPQDNGDDSPQGGFAAALTLMLAADRRSIHTAVEAQAFEQQLVAWIEHQLRLTPNRALDLGTDYGPDHILFGAAERAGVALTSTSLPIKTQMVITRYHVSVRNVYRAASEQRLWPLGA